MDLPELRRIKQIADDYYYKNNSQFLSDKVYDRICREIKELEKMLGISSTDCVGSDLIDGFEKVKHNHKMLSIDNVYSIEELEKWCKEFGNLCFSIEDKIDGMALSLIYEYGILVRAVTRGDGEIGDDVTKNAYQIKSIPKYVDGLDGEIRGEVYIDKFTFSKVNIDGEYKNARNLASGTMKLHDHNTVNKRNLSFKAYQFVTDNDCISHTISMNKLKRIGFDIVETDVISNIDNLRQKIEEYCQQKSSKEYDIDGVVIKVCDYEERKKYKPTNKYHKWQIAYKFPQEKTGTKLLSVDWQVGRTGVVTPVANLEPIEISGSTVKRASLHNHSFINGLGIHVNDIVLVEKGGEIIPEIIGILTESPNRVKIKIPDTCPDCYSTLTIRDRMIVCTNKLCPQMIIGKFEHFVSKGAMDIRGISRKTIEKLVLNNSLNDFSDIYELSKSELYKIDGLGDKSVEKLINNIENSKTVTFGRLIYSLGIPTVGRELSRELEKHFLKLQNLIDFVYSGEDFNDLYDVEGLGKVRACKLNEWFDDNFESFERLINYIEIKEKNEHGINRGSIVITGSLSLPREEIKDNLNKLGYKVTNSISKSTDFLLVGEKPGNKLKKAIEYGIKILNEEDIFNLKN